MDWLQALLLGIIQGLTEFLPVSSSGHLVIFQKVLGMEVHDVSFDVAVHLGTTLSVITIYFKTIKKIIIDNIQAITQRKKTPGFELLVLIVIGSVPTAIIGLSLKDTFEAMFQSFLPVGIAFAVTGMFLFFTRSRGEQKAMDLHDWDEQIQKIGVWRALLIGVAQGAAITPGISRSGATICAGIYSGVERNAAAMFSFMLAIPAIVGATILQLDFGLIQQQAVATPFLVGIVSSYLSGLVGLYGILHFVKSGRLEYFSYYLWALSLCALGYHFFA